MTYKILLLILAFVLLHFKGNAEVTLTACDHVPSVDNPCDGYDFNYLQYLTPTIQNNGTSKLEKQLFFILDDIKALKADTIVFKVFQTIDAKKGEYKFINERRVAVKKDWFYCWTKFVFDQANDYWIRAYNKDVLIEENFISIKAPK